MERLEGKLLSKFFLFTILWWIFGNPIIAIIVLLAAVYLLDRRFVGVFPSIMKPLRRAGKIRRLRDELRLSPHHTSNKLELARLLMDKGRFAEAKPLLEQVYEVMPDSADVLCELGLCDLKLGQIDAGEELILRAFEVNPRVKYGEPYVRLGEAFADHKPDKALHYLKQFGQMNSSSCEAYYRMGLLYKKLGQNEDARSSFCEAVNLYRSLPKYKRRHERKWALLSKLQAS